MRYTDSIMGTSRMTRAIAFVLTLTLAVSLTPTPALALRAQAGLESTDTREAITASLTGAPAQPVRTTGLEEERYTKQLTRAETTAKLQEWLGSSQDLNNFAGVNLAGKNLAGFDLRGRILTGAALRRAILTDAALRRAILTDATLTDADLTGADLTDATLRRAILTDATLRRAILTGADLTSAVGLAPAWMAGVWWDPRTTRWPEGFEAGRIPASRVLAATVARTIYGTTPDITQQLRQLVAAAIQTGNPEGITDGAITVAQLDTSLPPADSVVVTTTTTAAENMLAAAAQAGYAIVAVPQSDATSLAALIEKIARAAAPTLPAGATLRLRLRDTALEIYYL